LYVIQGLLGSLGRPINIGYFPLNKGIITEKQQIIGLEANHRIAVSVDGDGVAFCWHGGKVPPLTSVLALAACGPLANLELMPVKMERMDSGIEVVDYDCTTSPLLTTNGLMAP